MSTIKRRGGKHVTNHSDYIRRRLLAEEALAQASEGVVQATHRKFVAAYRERLAQLEAATLTVDQLLDGLASGDGRIDPGAPPRDLRQDRPVAVGQSGVDRFRHARANNFR